MQLQEALNNPLWKKHKPGMTYTMRNANGSTSEGWRITYYPIFEDSKGKYNERRALVERTIKGGFDFREIPLRYLE